MRGPLDNTEDVKKAGLCVDCGLCALNVGSKADNRLALGKQLRGSTDNQGSVIEDLVWEACPGKGVDYPSVYQAHYGSAMPFSGLGPIKGIWIGHAQEAEWRRRASSGGVLSRVLWYLLKSRRVDGVIVARQQRDRPLEAEWVILRDPDDVLETAQSVYTSVPMLESLASLVEGESYAITCVPDQAAALRCLQGLGYAAARQIDLVVGPVVGTGLQSDALETFLQKQNVSAPMVSRLRWRDGEWPGSLRIDLRDGRSISSPKFYYNHLTPAFVDVQSLQSQDFYNEFSDIAVGDAWLPEYERLGQGFSLVVARTTAAAGLLSEMAAAGELLLQDVELDQALAMHSHMRDFKSRGSYIRNQFRRALGMNARDTGVEPSPIPRRRYAIEVVVSSMFAVAGSRPGRAAIERIPDSKLGPLFASLRVRWKRLSKSSKRYGLNRGGYVEKRPRWR